MPATAMLNFTIAPASLHRLRRRLLAAGPGVAADMLQDAGFATGEALLQAWREHLAERTGLTDPGELDVAWFEPMLREVCSHAGWGDLSVSTIADRAILCTATNWAEAAPAESEQPGCYFTCGWLAAFLTALAGASIAVLEVECRSAGSDCCRFLAGSTETLSGVYDLIAAGGHWREAFS